MEENNFFDFNDSFEDIVSDTSKSIKKPSNDIEYFDTYSDSKYFKKNRHGIRKVFSLGDWWHDRKDNLNLLIACCQHFGNGSVYGFWL